MKSFKIKNKVLFIFIIFFAGIIRLSYLDKIPVSLYTDEANQGYNAYSILLTGKDEHGAFLPISLRSFGDWKPPLPAYLMIPFIAIFGLTEKAIRLPSVFLGMGTIILTYYLCLGLFKTKREGRLIAIISSFLLCVSPWHIVQSRTAMLVMVGLFFLELGIFLFIQSLKRPLFIIFSSISFVLSIYSYYGLRLIVPLFVFFLLYINRKRLNFPQKEMVVSLTIGILLLLPLIFGFFKNKDVVFGRAKTVSVFYDQGVKLRQWELLSQDGFMVETWVARLFHNNIYMFSKDIAGRYLSHFDLRFLTQVGDQASPFQIPNMGIIYYPDALLIIIGLFALFKNKYQFRNLIVFWVFISVLPSALSFMTPSSNRTFNMVIPLMIMSAIGLTYLISLLRKSIVKYLIISTIYGISIFFFLNRWFIEAPVNYSHNWSYEWDQVGRFLASVEKDYSEVYIFDNEGMAYIYILFHKKYDPALFQREAVRPYVADRFGFEHIESFGKYYFIGAERWVDFKDNLQKDKLYIVPSKVAQKKDDIKDIITFPNGTYAFEIFSKQKEL